MCMEKDVVTKDLYQNPRSSPKKDHTQIPLEEEKYVLKRALPNKQITDLKYYFEDKP